MTRDEIAKLKVGDKLTLEVTMTAIDFTDHRMPVAVSFTGRPWKGYWQDAVVLRRAKKSRGV